MSKPCTQRALYEQGTSKASHWQPGTPGPPTHAQATCARRCHSGRRSLRTLVRAAARSSSGSPRRAIPNPRHAARGGRLHDHLLLLSPIIKRPMALKSCKSREASTRQRVQNMQVVKQTRVERAILLQKATRGEDCGAGTDLRCPWGQSAPEKCGVSRAAPSAPMTCNHGKGPHLPCSHARCAAMVRTWNSLLMM